MAGAETLYNIVRCADALCLEFDCSARSWVENFLGFTVEESRDICTSALPFHTKDDAIRYLVEKGVPEERIAVEGAPFKLSVERGGRPAIRVCPVCGSVRIVQIGVLGLTPPLYVCENCGYRGALVLEVVI
ncbi:hypothetical protein IG193_03725 [Infirmifilum lucidum]|uniref:Uncharacterized protein n=1 Tax=Infirmifilum lucidum TaxID=2776706 RepID=A0A7L9FIN4_9CREN|nr:hypothetical protein [Infirmifilum lucidum]QOJ79577.1 hypothetical protein IG193_03725 [Infirmifilum lucidum]